MRAAFTERSAIEYGFAPVFRERLAPKLDSLRRERAAQSRMTWFLIAMILAGHVALLVFLYFMGFADEGFVFIMLFTAGIGIFELVRRRSGAFGQRLIEIVMPEISRFLGEIHYDREGPGDSFVTPFENLRLVGSSNSKTVEHHIRGTHRGVGFELVQAELLNRRRGSKNAPETVFKGLLVRIQVPVSVSPGILIARDHGRLINTLMEWFSIRRRKSAHRVPMRDAEFERRFAVYCADPETARSFVTPGFMSAIRTIDDEIGGRSFLQALSSTSPTALTAAFEGDTFYMAITRSKRLLDTRSLLRSDVSIEDEIHTIFADITLLHRIIDKLREG
jgi:hypothetical protein